MSTRRASAPRTYGGRSENKLQNLCNYCLGCFVISAAVVVNIFSVYVLIPTVFEWKWALIHFIIGNIETIFTLASFIKAMTVNPGLVVEDWDSNMDEDDRDQLLGLELQTKDLKPRFCQQCNTFKPPRAHHSSTLNTCVLRMDHYCVWVNNVVGLRNHKFFILFLFWVLIGMIHFYIVAVFGFIQLASSFQDSQTRHFIVFFILLLLATFLVPMGMVVMMFFGWTVFLLFTNQTSVEHHKNAKIRWTLRKGFRGARIPKFRHIYDVGWYDNICTVMGKNPLLWLWPFSGVGEDEQDGLRYKTIPVESILSLQDALRQSIERNDRELEARVLPKLPTDEELRSGERKQQWAKAHE